MLWRTGVWYNVAMEAFAIPDARDRVQEAVDALVDESIDDFSTHALGADLIDIRRAIEGTRSERESNPHRPKRKPRS